MSLQASAQHVYGKADRAVLNLGQSRVRVGSLVRNILPEKNPLIHVHKHYLCVTTRLTWEDLETFPGLYAQTLDIPLTEYRGIFRVPEYSEYLLRTGFVLGFRWEELGILKRGEKGRLRIVGLAQRTGRIR